METTYTVEIESLNYRAFESEMYDIGIDPDLIDQVYDQVRVFHNEVTAQLGEGNVGTLLEIIFDSNDNPRFVTSSYPLN